MSPHRDDITDRRDVMRLVNVFYDRLRDDDVLGPIFDEVAHVEWPAHLPRMYDFWDSVLFATGTFKGQPLEAHRALARLTPLTSREFDRWVALFHTTVDDLFSGAMADHAKTSAARIAVILRHHIEQPVVLLPLVSRAGGIPAGPADAEPRVLSHSTEAGSHVP
jgi:hemoglobin